MTSDHYRERLHPISRPIYDVLWRAFFVVALLLRPVARLIVWGYCKWEDRKP